LPAWCQKDVFIPVSAITYVDDETIYLKLDKYTIASLPTVPVREQRGKKN
jgi:hypothetical protein